MSEMMDNYRSEEDKIIESILVEGNNTYYDDADFLPIRQSLYNVETVIPIYDDDSFQNIVWCRPHVISKEAVYFSPGTQIGVVQGNLPDEVFIGALLSVATFPKYDLMENIFTSRPEDFKQYGVFTCRFYVEGDWVEVIADTNIPCLCDEETNIYTPLYSRSMNREEMWIALAEKAYAKAVGSYEAIPRVRLHEALMHLTGGSVQQANIQDPSSYRDSHALWSDMKSFIDMGTMILALPSNHYIDDTKDDLTNQMEKLTTVADENDISQHAFVANRLYSVISYCEADGHHLLLIHSAWSNTAESWFGAWSNKSALWEASPHTLHRAQRCCDGRWSLDYPNGYFWITCDDFHKHFNDVHFCKLFPTSAYKFYCIKDEWKEKQAGGPLTTVRDKAAALKDALESKRIAANKASVVTIIDSDSSWFNNPQIRISSLNPTKVFISCLPLSADKDGTGLAIGIDIIATKKTIGGMSADQYYIWDSVMTDIVASDKVDGVGRIKGQESSLWSLQMDGHHNYHIIPHTMKRGQDGYFLLRIFSVEPLTVEQIPSVYFTSLYADWHRSHDMDTTGGPLKTIHDNVAKENPKWSQNPQFHLELQDLFSKDDLKLKIVVRRTDKVQANVSHHRGIGGAVTGSDKQNIHESFVGMVVCRSDCLQENVLKNKLKKQPRLSAVGEIIPSKQSTLKKHSNQHEEEEVNDAVSRKDTFDITMIPRKYSMAHEPNIFESSYSSRTEASIFISKISRSMIPQGLMIIPSLHDKGVKGTFELEVYSSEPVILKQLPDMFNKSLASEWTEQNSGGSHVNANWKKNPKFSFHFRHTSKQLTNSTRIPIRITLGRHGRGWNALTKKDAVGCMIGFYIFVQHNNELEQIYESLFVPNDELSTEVGFTLTPLPIGDEYIIMPATCSEGKVGSFVLTIMTEAEFKFHKEKA